MHTDWLMMSRIGRLAQFRAELLHLSPELGPVASRFAKEFGPDQVLSGVRDEDRGASGQKQGWCIRRKAEGPKTETADFIGALKSPFLSVVHGVSRQHHW
jgi:hypothetical protein